MPAATPTMPAASSLQLHVSPVFGDDTWSGRLAAPNAARTDGPLATLTAARDALRAIRASAPCGSATVILRGGRYSLDATLMLGTEDGGTADAPVVWQAYPGEAVHLLGGRDLPAAALLPVTDASVLERLPEAARPHVRRVDLASFGLDGAAAVPRSRGFNRDIVPSPVELYAGTVRQTWARWPRTGYTHLGEVPAATAKEDSHGTRMGALDAGFTVTDERPFQWARPDQAWVYGFWAYDWADTYEAVASLDPATRQLHTRPPHGQYAFLKGQRYCYYNVLEELREPGDFVLDPDGACVYLWPSPRAVGEPLTIALLATPLVALTDVAHLTLRGLTLEAGRSHGVTITGGTACSLQSCTLRNLGNVGVVVDGGERHAVRACHIHDTGDGGVRLSGGDRATLTPGGHEVTDCHIHHFSVWSRCYRPAVNLLGVGHRVAHCLLHDAPHSAIIFMGNDHVIEANEIHTVCEDTGDCGAIYTGCDYTSRGTVIRWNYVHDINGPGNLGSQGVYLDDNASGITIHANLFVRSPRAAFIGGGMDNRVTANVMVDCHPSLHIDGRGMDDRRVWHDQVHVTMRQRYEAMNADAPPYCTHYPLITRIRPFFDAVAKVPPLGNVIDRNVVAGDPNWLQDVRWHARPEHLEIGHNLVAPDPGFEDLAAGDYRLRADSPAFALGFEAIPLATIGPRPQGSANTE